MDNKPADPMGVEVAEVTLHLHFTKSVDHEDVRAFMHQVITDARLAGKFASDEPTLLLGAGRIYVEWKNNEVFSQAEMPAVFSEQQWWLPLLDQAVASGTDDQKRAVAVVRNLIGQHAALQAENASDLLEYQNRVLKLEQEVERKEAVIVKLQQDEKRMEWLEDNVTGTVSVSRELLTLAVSLPSKESREANERGMIERGRAQAELRAILAQPAEPLVVKLTGPQEWLDELAATAAEQQDEPVCYINPDHLDGRMDETANGSTSCVIFNDSHGGCLAPLYLRPAAQAVTMSQVMAAYQYAEDHPHRYLRGTTNWCAAVAYNLNGIEP